MEIGHSLIESKICENSSIEFLLKFFIMKFTQIKKNNLYKWIESNQQYFDICK